MKSPLILINGLFLTEVLRGVQRYATEMVQAFSRVRHNYRILVVAPKGKLLRNLPHVVQDTFPLTGAAWEQIRLPLLTRKLKASLLYCPCNRAPLLRTKIPLVVTIHDAAVFSGPHWFTKPFQFFYQRYFPRIGKLSNKIITCSEFAKNDLIKYNIAVEKQISVIYEGANHLNNDNKPKRNVGEISLNNLSIDGKRYVLNVGSRDPRKNVKQLCTAWQRIPGEVKKNRILVIAGGKFYNNFADERISQLPDDIVFLGYVPEEQLLDLYKHADAFVFPSLYEGFGLPPLEAMACGLPVLVSQAASLPEVCGNAALYCNPQDVNDISDKLIQILTNRSIRERLQKEGTERATFFTWEKAAQGLLTIFDEIINGKD